MIGRAPALFALLLLSACHSDPRSARGVAERFVDEHYVRIDLEAAKAHCSGLALHKVEQEQRLTKGHPIDGATRMPTVRYRIVSEKESDTDATYVFAATIHVDSDEAVSARWIVTVRRTDGTWSVVNFSEDLG